jgi:hypothetical protein
MREEEREGMGRVWRVGEVCGCGCGCGKRARDYIIRKMTEPRDYLRYSEGTAELAGGGDSQRGLL